MGALDAYVVAGVFLPMISDAGVPLDHLERATPLISGFLFGYVVGIALIGPLSDARGRSTIYLTALVVFALGSVVTARAEDLATLVVGRGIQGFAGGALVPVALALVADWFPPGRSRLLALGVAAGAQEVGSLLGPVYGAVVSQWGAGLGGWRAIFWINLPLAGLCAAAFLAVGRTPAPTARNVRGLLAGGALALASGLLVLALYPDDPGRSALNSHALPLLAGSAGALGVFAWLRGWRPRPVVVVNVLVGGALVAALAEVPVLANTIFGLDQLGSALLLGRFLLGVPIGALLGGFLGARSRRAVAGLGMALAAVCFGLMSRWMRLDSSVPWVLFACGLGFGLVIAPVTGAILDAARTDEHGAAAAGAVLARTGGMLAGFGVLAAYGFHRFYGELAKCPRGGGLGALLGGGYVACATSAARDQYHDVFLLAAVVCAAAAVAALAWLE